MMAASSALTTSYGAKGAAASSSSRSKLERGLNYSNSVTRFDHHHHHRGAGGYLGGSRSIQREEGRSLADGATNDSQEQQYSSSVIGQSTPDQ